MVDNPVYKLIFPLKLFFWSVDNFFLRKHLKTIPSTRSVQDTQSAKKPDHTHCEKSSANSCSRTGKLFPVRYAAHTLLHSNMPLEDVHIIKGGRFLSRL